MSIHSGEEKFRSSEESPEDREDRLIEEGITLLKENGRLWPSLLVGYLKISLDEAEKIMSNIKARGLISDTWDATDLMRNRYNMGLRGINKKNTAPRRIDFPVVQTDDRHTVRRSISVGIMIIGFLVTFPAPPIGIVIIIIGAVVWDGIKPLNL